MIRRRNARDRIVPRRRALALILVVATLVALGRIAVHEFTWYDDPVTLFMNGRLLAATDSAGAWFENLAYHWTHPEQSIYIPLTQTLWAILAPLARVEPDELGIALNPWIFHSASIIVHTLSALAAFALLRRLVDGELPALLGALLYALHPVQVESVAWASGMKDLLFGLFALLALWQYARFRAAQDQAEKGDTSSRQAYALATSAALLSMLSKPTGMVVPLLAGALDLWLLRRTLRQSLRALAPWLIASAICAIIARAAQGGAGIESTPLWQRPLLAADALAFYLYKLIWPVNLAVDYGRRPRAVMATHAVYLIWLIPAALALALWLARRRFPHLWTAALIFVLGMLPVLGLVRFSFQFYSTTSDHYLYLSMLGPALALAWLMSRFRATWARAIAITWLVLLGFRTIHQAGYWSDDRTLWAHNLAVNPDSFLAHSLYGQALGRAGDVDSAQRHLHRALEIEPRHAHAHETLIRFYESTGQFDRALHQVDRYIQALQTYPPEARAARLQTAQTTRQRLLDLLNRPATAPSPAR